MNFQRKNLFLSKIGEHLKESPFMKKLHKRLNLSLVFSLGISVAASGMAHADVFSIELEKALMASDKIASVHQTYLSAREDVSIATSGTEWSSNVVLDSKRANKQTNGGDFTRNDSRNLTLNVKKKLYDGGVGAAQETVAMITLDLVMQQINMTEQSVLLEAIRAYTGLAEAQDRVEINRANVKRLEEYLKAAQLQLDIGEITPTDFAGTRARFARANAGLIQAESALSSQRATYEAVIGPVPSRLDLPNPDFNLPSTAMAAGDRAIENHPSYRIASLQERIARKTMDVLIAGVRPNVDLTLSGKTTDATSVLMDTENYSATVMLSMPLFPSSSVYAKSRGAVADHREALYSQKDAAKSTRLQAQNAFRAYQSAQAVIAAYEAEFEAAAIFRDGTTQEVQFGEKTLLDQLDAEQDVVNAELNLLIAKHDHIDAVFSLLASIGALTSENLGLVGMTSPEDAEPIKSPIMAPFPIIDYPE